MPPSSVRHRNGNGFAKSPSSSSVVAAAVKPPRSSPLQSGKTAAGNTASVVAQGYGVGGHLSSSSICEHKSSEKIPYQQNHSNSNNNNRSIGTNNNHNGKMAHVIDVGVGQPCMKMAQCNCFGFRPHPWRSVIKC